MRSGIVRNMTNRPVVIRAGTEEVAFGPREEKVLEGGALEAVLALARSGRLAVQVVSVVVPVERDQSSERTILQDTAGEVRLAEPGEASQTAEADEGSEDLVASDEGEGDKDGELASSEGVVSSEAHGQRDNDGALEDVADRKHSRKRRRKRNH